MKLHKNTKLFEDAILATSQSLNIREIYIEKDYWVTFALSKIFHSDMAGVCVFKGGTALSKCYKIIERFSEDIDLVVVTNEGESDNQKKNKIRDVGNIIKEFLPEIRIDGITNKRGNIRKTVHKYEKKYTGDLGQVRDQIILEVSWLGNFEPYIAGSITCYISDMMKKNGQDDLIEKYDLQAFRLNVLSKERTFCEKIMSLVRFSRQANPYDNLANKIRHIYDIHMILNNSDIMEFFEGSEFERMLIKVGKDDVISYRNYNEWLFEHPKSSIIFSEVENTWQQIRTTYFTTFKDIVIGDLPPETEIVTSIKRVSKRLEDIKWKA